jgi:signal transduction histidine kinase
VIAVLFTGGLALVAYVFAWIAIPVDERQEAEARPGRRGERSLASIPVSNWRVAAGVGFLTLSFLLVLRELGIWWSDAIIWPAILAASGAALLWRQMRSLGGSAGTEERTASETLTAAEGGTLATAPRRRNVADLYKGGFGIAMVMGAALLFLWANGALGAASEVVLAIVVASVALALILAPFLWRLGRNLAEERASRIRSQERAELAAHLHDSVLQTLTLVQKRAGDPREVAQLARRQERELREWLFGEGREASTSLAKALEEVAVEVEEAHRVPVEVVAVGDLPMNERAEALVAAAREAMVNAAKFAPDAGEIAVYAELADGRAEVFVRDRGPGFDPDAIPADRRGVRESIIGRMERFGGSARVRSSPGRGTEVSLVMEVGE